MTPSIGVDGYEFRARFLPSVVVGLPILLAVVFCFPSLRDLAPAAVLAALLAGCASLFSEFNRAPTASSEWKLRESECGVRLLTWADDEIEPRLKREVHAALAKLLPEYPILNAQEEKLDPTAAIIYCGDVISALKPSFSDQRRFPLVRAELVSLGFRRNILELKSFAVWSCRVGAILGLICTILSPSGVAPSTITLLAACLCTGAAYIFEKTITLSWVCSAERDYVRQLVLTAVSASRQSYSTRGQDLLAREPNTSFAFSPANE